MEFLGRNIKGYFLSILAGLSYSFLAILVSFFITPYTLKFLNKEEYALFQLSKEIIVWMGILFLGLRGSFKLQLASNSKNITITKSLSTNFLATQIFVSGLFLFVGIFISIFIDTILDCPNHYANEIRLAFILLIFATITSIISGVISTILSVNNNDQYLYLGKSILLLIQTVIFIYLLNQNLKLEALAIASLISELIFLLFSILLLKFKFKSLPFNFHAIDLSVVKKSFRLSKWILIGFIGQLLIKHTDLILIGKFESINLITNFILTSKLYVIGFILIQTVANTSQHRLIDCYSRYNYSTYLKICLTFSKFILFLVLITGTSIYFINSLFIEWWVGKNYFLGASINSLLLIIFIVNSTNLYLRIILDSTDKEFSKIKSYKIRLFIEGIINFILSILLGLYFGIKGILIASLISAVSTSTIYLSNAYLKLFKGVAYFKLKKTLINGLILLISFITVSVLILTPLLKSISLLTLVYLFLTIGLIFALFLFIEIKKLNTYSLK